MDSKKEDKEREDWFGDNHLEGKLNNLDDLDSSYKSTIKKTKEHFTKFDLTEPFKKFVMGKKK